MGYSSNYEILGSLILFSTQKVGFKCLQIQHMARDYSKIATLGSLNLTSVE